MRGALLHQGETEGRRAERWSGVEQGNWGGASSVGRQLLVCVLFVCLLCYWLVIYFFFIVLSEGFLNIVCLNAYCKKYLLRVIIA